MSPIFRAWIALALLVWVGPIAIAKTDAAKAQVKLVEDFYRCYLDFSLTKHPKGEDAEKLCLRQHPLFSKAAQKAIRENKKACEPYKDEVCGFGADSDIFLDCQDFGDGLNFKSSGFRAKKVGKADVEVEFDLFPGSHDRADQRRIRFMMVRDPSGWRVDDIIYLSRERMSMRQAIRDELKSLKRR